MCMRKGAGKLAVFDLTPSQKTPQTLIECRMNCENLLQKALYQISVFHQIFYFILLISQDSNLLYMLKRYGGRTLIFGNSVSAIRRLQALLRKLTITTKGAMIPRLLHGRMKERERLKSMERFARMHFIVILISIVIILKFSLNRTSKI